MIFSVIFDQLKKAKMIHFWGKIWLRILEKKLRHINSDEILSKFCSLYFLSNLEKNAFKISSFVRFVRMI